ncbi:MAG TPA: 4-coumarate--CoA ligase family protein [Pyrinomonadaceae bacterium]
MIFRSPFPDVSVPEISLTELIFERARTRTEKPALIDGLSGRTLTYGQLMEQVRRVAAGLAARGFRKGDVLALYSPNCPDYAVVFHAVASLGGINTTINPVYTADEAAHQLRDASADYLVTTPQLVEKVLEAVEGSEVREVFIFGEAKGATPFSALLESDADTAPRVSIDPRRDLVALPYSSGTTGLPKGVMLTHYNLVANLLQIEGTGHAFEHDTLVCVLPLFHIYGMTVIMNFGLYTGATIITMPRFELELTLQVIERYRVTMAHFVPPIILALAKHPALDAHDLSSLKTIFSAAAPLGEQVASECSARLGCFLKQGYGMTEASPATHMAPHDPARVKQGSVGLPVPNTECKIVDVETGAERGAGQEGEILVRGPQVMKGYLNRPEATAQTIDADGWLHTGDIGYADSEGCFFIVDRAKELIKYKGFQVAPAELEAILLSHPSVADAAVIPSPDDEAGEVPKAFVIRRDDVTADALISFVAGQVAPYKKIRKLEFIEQIPKSPSGKILRRLLVQRERAGDGGKGDGG